MTSIGPPVSGLTDHITCKIFIAVRRQSCESMILKSCGPFRQDRAAKQRDRVHERLNFEAVVDEPEQRLICMAILIILILDVPPQSPSPAANFAHARPPRRAGLTLSPSNWNETIGRNQSRAHRDNP